MRELSEEILNRAAGGDRTAFKEVYDAASGLVYSVALRIVRHTADAEEVTQDVFLKVYHHLKDFEARSSFKTWLYRITVNTALSFCKQKSRESNRRVEDDSIISIQPVPSQAGRQIEQAETEAVLKSLLSVLKPEERACLILREIEDFSYKEIAGILKLNLNTVRTRLKRAREALVMHVKKGVVCHGL